MQQAPLACWGPAGRHEYHARTCCTHLNVRLTLDPVQIFMQAVQQEGQQLLAVLLPVPLELRGKFPQLVLEVRWRDRSCVTLQQWCKRSWLAQLTGLSQGKPACSNKAISHIYTVCLIALA